MKNLFLLAPIALSFTVAAAAQILPAPIGLTTDPLKQSRSQFGRETVPTGKPSDFADLALSDRRVKTSLAHLPQPVLLRLPSDILFGFDSAQLRLAAAPLLDQAIAVITKYPEADIHIDGYCDSFGKFESTTILSQERAEAVQAWLQGRIAQGTYRFSSTGHGSTNYIVPATDSIDQQQPNRRFEILIRATK
jgi:outer membrane protein OmpA-like peptidoglycan-associated protein